VLPQQYLYVHITYGLQMYIVAKNIQIFT